MLSTSARPAISRVRWIICGLLFFATVIAYVDRGILAFLEKFLEGRIGFTSVEYSYMTLSFQFAYGVGLVVAGGLTDKLGIRKSFAIAIVIWSVAAMLPGAASSVPAFTVAMFMLGIGESANFPACIKTVAQWFPSKERALATGLFNAGANVGNLLVPLSVPFLTAQFTWRGAFLVGGSLGILWLIFWLWLYKKPEEHPWISDHELEHIQSGAPPQTGKRVPWAKVLPRKETWAFAVGKALTDPVWWFWTFWLPGYFQTKFHLTLSGSSAPIVIVYVLCTIGSVGGGWISSFLLGRGMSVNVARKTAMLICALCALPVLYAPFSENLWLVVILVGLAGAAHQGWSANLFTLTSDFFPQAAVGSVVGIGGLCGAWSSAAVQRGIGQIVSHSYIPCFIFAGSAYLISWLIIHLISPKLLPAKLD